jgi:hypothetical protein
MALIRCIVVSIIRIVTPTATITAKEMTPLILPAPKLTTPMYKRTTLPMTLLPLVRLLPNMWLFVTVASVVAAVGAIHIGQKKNPNGSRGRHELTGVVSRRATLVSAFANGLMPGKETPIADEGVEVSPGLSLDYSPTGEVEMHPGYNLA